MLMQINNISTFHGTSIKINNSYSWLSPIPNIYGEGLDNRSGLVHKYVAGRGVDKMQVRNILQNTFSPELC